MSSTSTTKDTGENVATTESPTKKIGEAKSEISVKDELLPQVVASNNGTQATTAEIESGNVPVGNETKKKEGAAAKSKPKKVEAAAKPKTPKAEAVVAKSQPKKVEAVATKSKPQKAAAAATKSKTSKTEAVVSKSKPKKTEAATKTKPEKVAQKKAVSNVKSVAVNGKKIKLASSTYHYYRNWLAEFMRSHGVPSAKFQKAAESYNGHITVLETEKEKGLKALEQWSRQNPDTKELFWDIKK